MYIKNYSKLKNVLQEKLEITMVAQNCTSVVQKITGALLKA